MGFHPLTDFLRVYIMGLLMSSTPSNPMVPSNGLDAKKAAIAAAMQQIQKRMEQDP